MFSLKNNIVNIDGNTYDKDDLIGLYRLQNELLVREDIVASLEECVNIWSAHSDDLAASWLFFPDNGSLVDAIKFSEHFTSFAEYAED